MKTIFEFNDEEQDQVKMTVHRLTMWSALDSLESYRRELYKYESREEIPVQEVIDKLDEILDEYRKLGLD